MESACHACHAMRTLSPFHAAHNNSIRCAKNTQHDSSKVLRLPRKREDAHVQSAAPATKHASHLLEPCKSIARCKVKQNDSRHFFRHVRTSRNARPATQNNIRTCFETLDNERVCSFPHRHGDATRKPENRDETCWSLKMQ